MRMSDATSPWDVTKLAWRGTKRSFSASTHSNAVAHFARNPDRLFVLRTSKKRERIPAAPRTIHLRRNRRRNPL